VAVVEIKDLLKLPDLLLTLFNNYWLAVRSVFPEAWQNKKEYILLQSIGLNGFAMLGGKLIKDAVESGSKKLHQSDFEILLQAVAENVNLSKANPEWDAVAGAGGARKVYEKLVDELTPSAENIAKLKAEFLPNETTEQAILKK